MANINWDDPEETRRAMEALKPKPYVGIMLTRIANNTESCNFCTSKLHLNPTWIVESTDPSRGLGVRICNACMERLNFYYSRSVGASK